MGIEVIISNSKWFTLAISQKLHDQYLPEWYSVADTSACGSNYRLFKETFGYSSYFPYFQLII